MKTPTQTTLKKSGFTLIEIVIVLAIAALIMVIVFVAVRGAQRSRRDTEKRAVASRVLASLTNCASDNNGTIGTAAVLCTNYISNNSVTGITASGMTVAAPSVTAAAPGPVAAAIGTGTCTITPAATVSTSAGGTVCVYYFSEASNSVVFLAGTI